ncbi:MAG TPA: hypothetical protein VF984_07060 [Actinomycetota bacterium]
MDRLFDSFNLPLGPVRYLELMNPPLPEGETVWSRLGLTPHGRAWRTVKEEWPKVRAEIDAGHPCPLGLVRMKSTNPLGLVRMKSTNPFDLKENHQVLAHGYDLVGSWLTLHLYDPNEPGRGDVTMTLSLTSSTRAADITVFPPGPTVFAVFQVAYQPATPP